MAYEQKPGQGSIFKNDKKVQGDNQPEYKGSLMTPDGVECWVSVWVKRPEGKQPFFSLSIQAKEQQLPVSEPAKPTEPVANDLTF